MNKLLAVAMAACALSGPSTAEEITLVESNVARVMIMTGSIRFGAEGQYASADMVLTHVSDGARYPISMIAICHRDGRQARGIGLVSYQDDKVSDEDRAPADGSKAFDSIARALCGRVGLRAWAEAQP